MISICNYTLLYKTLMSLQCQHYLFGQKKFFCVILLHVMKSLHVNKYILIAFIIFNGILERHVDYRE